MTEAERGVCLIAYGQNARREAQYAVRSIRRRHDLPIAVIGEPVEGVRETIDWPNAGMPGRWAKVNLHHLSPFGQTLYLDADTRVHPRTDLLEGFRILDDGWDLVICPSDSQGDGWLWHLSDDERATTHNRAWPGAVLQGGLFWVGAAMTLWRAWRLEWVRFSGPDQGALLRALVAYPARVWLLRQQALIKHNFGRAKLR